MEHGLSEPAQSPSPKRLTRAQRVAVVAEVGSGRTIGSVANDFGVHRNSVSRLVNEVRREVKGGVLDPRSSLTTQISNDAKSAIHASIKDANDVHKAANTGLSWLKGTGELFADSGQTNVFITQIQQLPSDWQGEYASLDGPQDVDSLPEGIAE